MRVKELEEEGNGELFNGYSFNLGRQKVLEMNSDDVCTIM